MVPAGTGPVADIGAGDGDLAAVLAASGRRVIAGEAGPAPFARLAARRATLVECRLGDGLGVLAPGEVEGAVIAGMGGHRIAAILAASPGVVAGLSWIVLQPQQHAPALLAVLPGAGLAVDAEARAVQGGHLYRVLLVRPAA